MKFELPLERRQREARTARDRYWRNPQERLSRINAVRAKRGRPLLAGVHELPEPRA